MMKIRFFAMLVYAFLFCLPASAGSFKSNATSDRLIFTGSIEPGDDIKLANLTRTQRYGGILLNTDGGDVATALSMGRIMRGKTMAAVVLHQSVCRSACVFLLAGAVERTVYGEVAIHRPYYSELSPDRSTEEVARAYKALNGHIRSYLQEMNVPTALADAMFAIRPENARVLGTHELTSFMLNQRDPVYDEMMVASFASKYRLSSAEYRKLDDAASKLCDAMIEDPSSGLDYSYDDFEACRLSVIANLPMAVAKTRYQIYQNLLNTWSGDSDIVACMTFVYLDGATRCPRSP